LERGGGADRVVVFGASGFIGTRLVRRLAGQGLSVLAADIEPPRERLDGVDYRSLDVRAPIPTEVGEGASRIYNLAAVHRTPGHPDHEYYDCNVAGALTTAALAEACGIPAIVFTSSISVYGPQETAVSEESALTPTTAYGRSKRLAELVYRQWRRAGPGRRLVTVRPGVVFGPGERGNYTRLANALRGGYFAYPGRKDTIKSGGYVDELLRTLEFALARDEPEILYNFAYPAESSTADIVAAFGRITGKPRNPPTVPVAPLRLAAHGFEIANRLGLKNSIHRDRVMKLVLSTRVKPGWLTASGYQFATDLDAALTAWSAETGGRFD
jgi:nucleoside-diphosphate-sugar epimerase